MVRASGLADYAYTHPKGAPWPTLRELVDTDRRVVLFEENEGGTPAYLHRAYADEMWDTPYSFKTQADFTCAEAGRAPTFVSVDFYDVGDLFGVVRKANGL